MYYQLRKSPIRSFGSGGGSDLGQVQPTLITAGNRHQLVGQRRFLLACFGLHFLLIFVVGLRDTFSIFAKAQTVFPASFQPGWRTGEEITSQALASHFGASNPVRNVISVYLHAAGIEAGYGFFAPNVPDNYKLVFELHYLDERVEYDVPAVRSAAAGLRLAGLLDQIAEADYEPLRQTMVKILTYANWQEHPEAIKVRSVLGLAVLPTPAEFERGAKESYIMLYAYDFAFRKSTLPGTEP